MAASTRRRHAALPRAAATVVAVVAAVSGGSAAAAAGTSSVPVPSDAQLRLMQRGYVAQPGATPPTMGAPLLPGLTMFMHFGPCTFMDTGYHTSNGCQWDIQAPLGAPSGPVYPDSVAPAAAFNPAGLDADQWMRAATSLGASQVCLTVRHVDGFALWPTATTNYSVASSPWKGGKGDVVGDFVAAALRHGISPCFYIILGFDVHANQSGVPPGEYLSRQGTALTELLTRYGHIDRLWWDNYEIGCCQPVTASGLYCEGGGTQPRNASASGCSGWDDLIATVRRVSPGTAVVPGPDGCLVNGEHAGGTYPLFNSGPPTGGSYSCDGAAGKHAGPGAGGTFVVSESDYSLVVPGWFWNAGMPHLTAGDLWEQFTLKYGHGANLILNVPPNRSGLVPEEYAAVLSAFGKQRLDTYSHPVAVATTPASAPCAELSMVVAVPPAARFDQTVTMEDLAGGQRITGYTIEARDAATGAWRRLPLPNGGGTVGARNVDWGLGTQTGVSALRWNCTSSLAPGEPVTVASFAAYLGATSRRGGRAGASADVNEGVGAAAAVANADADANDAAAGTDAATAATTGAAAATNWTVVPHWNAVPHGDASDVKTLEGCEALCDATPGCAQWTWNYGHAPTFYCFLSKSTSWGGTANDHITSGCDPSRVKGCGAHPPAPPVAPRAPKWAVEGAPDGKKKFCGFRMAANVSTTVVYRATRELGLYNHAAMMDYHNGTLFLTWKNSPLDEDTPGQRVLYAQSADGARWTATDGTNVLFPNMSSAARPAALFGGPTVILNGKRYATASPHQFCLFPFPYAANVTSEEDTNVLLMRRVGSGVPAELGPIFWASRKVPAGFEEASEREGVVPSSRVDAETRADLAALADSAVPPCGDAGAPGAGTLKCEACVNTCGATTRCERTHYVVPRGGPVGGEVILQRTGDHALNFAWRPNATAAWSDAAASAIPDVDANLNSGALPNGRAFLASNPCPHNDAVKGRDPLVVSTTANGWTFDAALGVMSCELLGQCGPRVPGRAKGPGPSYPQAVTVLEPPAMAGLYVVATNNKEDVVVARVPFASL